MLALLEESSVFAQNKQEPVSRTGNVTLGHPSKIYTSVVHNGGRKVWKTFPSARAEGQQGQQGPRTAAALREGAAEQTTAFT